MPDTTAAARVTSGPARDWRLLLRVLSYVRPHLAVVCLFSATVLGGTLVELLQPWLTQQAIDKYVATGDLEGLSRLALLLCGTLVVGFACDYGRTHALQLVGQRVVSDLRVDAYRHLQRLDLRFYDRHPIGNVMATVTADLNSLNELFASGALLIVGNLLTLAGMVVAMIGMDWRLAGVTFAMLPFAAWISHWFQVHVRQASRSTRAAAARLSGFTQEHLAGMATVQQFGQERRTLQRFDELNAASRDSLGAAAFYFSALNPAIEVVASVSIVLIVWVGGLWVMSGSVSIGVLVAFVLYLRRFFQPFLDLAEKANVVQGSLAATERIFALMDTPPRIASPAAAPRRAARASGRVEFDRVSFAYSNKLVLKDVSFVIEPGERVGIVGPTGSGKTTLIHLLLRLYDVTAGRILVDGVDVREWHEDELRRVFNVVLQDAFVFPGSVLENMGGDGGETRLAEIQRLARELGIDGFIESHLGGYGTIVSEGSPISVGQKQLLALARAMMSEESVVVLDEATSGLDSQTEARVLDLLSQRTRARTLIAVAHRLGTTSRADRILAFHRGELAESGTHRELMNRQGLYFRLHGLQRADPPVPGRHGPS